jgi:hypothetical protein
MRGLPRVYPCDGWLAERPWAGLAWESVHARRQQALIISDARLVVCGLAVVAEVIS